MESDNILQSYDF